MRTCSGAIAVGISCLLLFSCVAKDQPTARQQNSTSFERTAFTLSLIGQAPRMSKYALEPSLTNATDLAYCAAITGDDVRSGEQPFVERLQTLVGDKQTVQRLIEDAVSFERQALSYARRNSDPRTVIYFNFGGHADACERAINPDLEDLSDCEEAFKKNPVPTGLQHSNTHETSITYDGKYLAALVWGEERNRISVFDLQSGTRKVIALSDNQYELDAPSISGNGKWIAIQATDRGGSQYRHPNGLLIVPVDGGEAVYISSPGANYGPPALSPNGDKLFYAKYDTGIREHIVDGAIKRAYEPTTESRNRARKLYEIDLTTRTERLLSDQAFEAVLDPIYAPDGRGVIFRFMNPIGNDGRGVASNTAPKGLPYGGSYKTFFSFGEKLPLWPDPVVPIDAGRFSGFGPDGILYGSKIERVSKPNADSDKKRRRLSIWKKSSYTDNIEIIDSFDLPSTPGISNVSGSILIPASSTIISLVRRELHCFKQGARNSSDPFIQFNDRGEIEARMLSELPITEIYVQLPKN